MDWFVVSPSLIEDNEVVEGDRSGESNGLWEGVTEEELTAESTVTFLLKASLGGGSAVVDIV